MSTLLEKVAKSAKPVLTKQAIKMAPVKFAVQQTETYRRLASPNGDVEDLGFPVIDTSAFQRLKFNPRCGAKLPVFGFFWVNSNPTIKGVVKVSTTQAPDFRWEGVDQPVQLDANNLIGFMRTFYTKNLKGLLAIGLLLAALSIVVGTCYIENEVLQLDWAHLDAYGWFVLNVFGVLGGLFATLCGLIKIADHNFDTRYCKTFTAKLDHIIPDRIVSLIEEHYATFNQGMAIVADVSSQWAVTVNSKTTITPIPKVDPLLIGVHNRHYYLVAKFDLTPEEAYIASAEFTS